MTRSLCIAIVGPTASGKSKLALDLAAQLPSEIVCMDATTVYKHFDIGANKPSAQDRERLPHHLVDVVEPEEAFSAHHFSRTCGTGDWRD